MASSLGLVKFSVANAHWVPALMIDYKLQGWSLITAIETPSETMTKSYMGRQFSSITLRLYCIFELSLDLWVVTLCGSNGPFMGGHFQVHCISDSP